MYDTDPIEALLAAPGPGALAVIAGLTGPFYRPLGAMMSLLPDGTRVGSLSSGCVEADIALNAQEALAKARPRLLSYGAGAPFIDIRLPCGGGMEVLLLPNPDLDVLRALQAARARREACTLLIDRESGALSLEPGLEVEGDPRHLAVAFPPALQLLVFGAGPEAVAFTALASAAGYDHHLLSPDEATAREAIARGGQVRAHHGPGLPPDLGIDAATAIVLFFHDHDREPPLLAEALQSPAFYVGAQGSKRANAARLAALRDMGVDEAGLARLSGPIGLIASARDPQTLALSVLAEIVAQAQ